MEKLIIDRFEGIYAVCEKEDRTYVNIPRSELPLDCREGDCLIRGEKGIYRTDIIETNKRIKQIQEKMKRLYE